MAIFWRSWEGMAGVSREVCKVKIGNYGYYLSMPAFQTPVNSFDDLETLFFDLFMGH
jgi:hypothetical protein